jgi:hypothetical protein
MLSSCAAGVMVVNIDNGFGAGFAAARINALRGIEQARPVEAMPQAGEARNVCA